MAEVIDSHVDDILKEWDAFVASQFSSAENITALAGRDHRSEILRTIAEDLRQPQTSTASFTKSPVLASAIKNVPETGAEMHGRIRAEDGFSITEIVSEYRALRATVMRLWTISNTSPFDSTAIEDVTRFNQALDQAIAESVDYFNQVFSSERIARDNLDKELKLNRGRLEYASRLSHVGFWYCDLPFDVLEWDAQVKNHFFVAPDAAVTIEDFYDRIHPEDRERTRLAIAESISSRDAYDIIYRTLHPMTGEVKWIRALGGTDYDADGNPIHFDGITVDVTAQKLVEMRVAESEARHRGVISNMDEAFALFDPDFNIIEVNDATCRFVDMPRSQLLGANHWEQFPQTYESEIGHMYRQVQADGQPKFMEHHYVFPDGRAFWFEVRAFKVGDGVAVVFRDITDRIEMIEALKESDKRKDEFLAMLAHELRNPLAPIVTAGEILWRVSHTNDSVARPASIIRRQAKHMTRLIDDLLDVSRVTQGHIHLQKEVIYIADVLAQAVEMCEPQLQMKQQTLTTFIDPIASLLVEGDKARLVQCVANILTNAIKYSETRKEIKINVRSEEAEAIIEVVDTGSGIAPEMLPQIFQLFVQSQVTLDRSQGGLGVGLAIVQRLIAMHGGRVSAFSQGEGLGSTFEIRLPRVDSATTTDQQAKLTESAPMRILIVDDNIDAADTLLMITGILGHESMAVHTAQKALSSIESFKPDIMLIDIGLPDMDGYQLAQQIAKLPSGKNVRKIALTGYGQPDDKLRAFDAGFDEHLVKPVEVEKLEWAINGSESVVD
ncbi:MAG TPA: ATP-binding protein [Methylophilus sp.]|uniref:ATP-binding protein n=1 Tax=Methylophilus sp. TaxID=29541 RepID=UPI002BD09A4A|nr:ATP-binding protein [Methylophilus sp.]HSH87152.1 ATP-binding protein [Methylophilus sp.]